MTPLDQMRQVYAAEPCLCTLAEDIGFFQAHGLVFDLPEFFVMGRPVVKSAGYHAISVARTPFLPDEWDCWHIQAMAGDLKKVWEVLPFDLPWIGFERMNNLRFYRTARMRRLSHEFPSPVFS